MANELSRSFNGTATLYATLRRPSDGYVWNGSTFAVWADGSIGTYDIPLTSFGGDFYAADMPSTIAAGYYHADYYQQAGGSPAISDLRLDGRSFFWTGGSAVDSGDPGDAAGYYANAADLLNRISETNLTTITDLTGSGTFNATRLQLALDYADQYIDRYLRRNGWTVPIPEASGDFGALTEAASFLAIAWLYEARRWRDDPSQEQSTGEAAYARNSHHQKARRILYELVLGGILGADRNAGDQDAFPLAVG